MVSSWVFWVHEAWLLLIAVDSFRALRRADNTWWFTYHFSVFALAVIYILLALWAIYGDFEERTEVATIVSFVAYPVVWWFPQRLSIYNAKRRDRIVESIESMKGEYR